MTPAARRIAVVGVTGCGKTTFAAALAAARDLPHVELDALHWEPNWVPADLAVFRDRVAHAVSADRWVADGNDSKVRDLVWGRADTVVWLDYSFPVVFARLVRRTLVRVQTGEELWNGNRERWRDQFLSGDSLFLWAIKSYPKHRRTYPTLLASPPYRHLRAGTAAVATAGAPGAGRGRGSDPSIGAPWCFRGSTAGSPVTLVTAAPVGGGDVARLFHLVLDRLNSPTSKALYRRALLDFLGWSQAQTAATFDKATVQRYRATLLAVGLAPSTINQKLSAIRALAAEAADTGLLDPQLAAGVGKVKGIPSAGTRTGNWLTLTQAQRLLDAPDVHTGKGVRDRAILAVLLGCGLRRSEIAMLTVADVQQRDGRWVIVDLVGKHHRVRSIPMPSWTKAAIDAWTHRAGIATGRVFRSVRKGGHDVVGAGLSTQAIADVVADYAQPLGIAAAPHDCRRTFAKLALKGGARLEQIQLSLGHASIRTTERYLGVEQDLTDAPCDRLGLRL